MWSVPMVAHVANLPCNFQRGNYVLCRLVPNLTAKDTETDKPYVVVLKDGHAALRRLREEAHATSTFVLTGVFWHCGDDREKIQALIAKKGGRTTGAVSGRTTYLVVGDLGGFGMKKIEQVALRVIRHDKCPFYVMLQGEKLPHLLHRPAFEAAERGWYYSQSKKCVEIKYPYPHEDYEVVISFEPFDMIGM